MKIDPKKIGRMRGADLDAPVGANAVLEPQGVGQRFKTSFIGWEEGKFVALKLPSKIELRDHLYTGKLVIVRFVNRMGQICGFESAIQTSIVTPHRILFLDFPHTIEFLSLRKENRVDCFLPATLRREDDVMDGRLVNISRSGCRFATLVEQLKAHPPVQVEAPAECEFRILGLEDSAYTVKALIKKTFEEKGLAHVGLQFSEVPDAMQQRIDTYVNEAIQMLGPSTKIEDLR